MVRAVFAAWVVEKVMFAAGVAARATFVPELARSMLAVRAAVCDGFAGIG
jgi:hypothetical protein